MTKSQLRGFAGGLFLSAALMAYVHFTGGEIEKQAENKETPLTENEVKAFLEKRGKIAVERSAYRKLKEQAEKQQAKTAAEDEKIKENNKTTGEQTKTYVATIEVQPGMSSQQVIDRIVSANIISDGDKLFEYLEDHGLLQKVQIGTYRLSSEMSIAEIAEKIT